MAIHESLPGLKVEVIANREALPEYVDNDLEIDSDEIVNFVEARAGVSFAVKCSFNKKFPKDKDANLELLVNGSIIDSPIIDRRFLSKRHSHKIATVDKKAGKKWVARHLQFSKLNIGE